MPNRLQFEQSPYLLQHKENPVDWFPWGKEAFEKARAEDKPVFLSIGYSTCHWCHVMGRESFADETVAQVLNRAFVSIKVDREERPDVDGVYMAACIAANGSGGWPLSVLVTHDQKPFWAGTYLPKRAFLSLLEQVEQLWREDRESLLAAGDALTAYLQRQESSRADTPKRELVEKAAEQYLRLYDPRWGGFGQAPKFPTPHNLIFLMRYARRSGKAQMMEMAEGTLEAMYRGGLFDHVGGGFSRYSTDDRWLVPHFEKMLYDNALLLFAYAEAYQHRRRPLYALVARRTAAYVLRELEAPDGGFFCGQDADSEGEEGKYYIFTPSEIQRVLGEKDADVFCRRYGITEEGNFEGQSIPNLIGQEDIDGEDGMDALRETLRLYRQGRVFLHKDDKILTAWNALVIAALAKAGIALEETEYIHAAERAAAFLERNLSTEDGRLLARWRRGEGGIPGKLEDYAFYAWGLLELYQATFHLPYLARAKQLAQMLLTFFFDQEQGGLYPYASDDEQLLTRSKEAYDGAMPSGNAVAALVFSRLGRLSGETRWQEAAQLQFPYLAGAAAQYPAGHSFTMLALLEELWPTEELICAGREIPEELRRWLGREDRSELTVLIKTPENQEVLSELAPFTEAYPIPEQGEAYYLCRGGACKQPVRHLSELKELL